jgi:hypothetical protein
VSRLPILIGLLAIAAAIAFEGRYSVSNVHVYSDKSKGDYLGLDFLI